MKGNDHGGVLESFHQIGEHMDSSE